VLGDADLDARSHPAFVGRTNGIDWRGGENDKVRKNAPSATDDTDTDPASCLFKKFAILQSQAPR
jgi:hypothetical protein